MSREDVERRRQERRNAADKAREQQVDADLEAIDKLEAESGEVLQTLDAPGHKSDCSVTVAYRAPSPVQYKRYADRISRSNEKTRGETIRKAQDELAEVCWVYPVEADARKAMLEAFPGTLVSIAIEAVKLAELAKADEGKG